MQKIYVCNGNVYDDEITAELENEGELVECEYLDNNGELIITK